MASQTTQLIVELLDKVSAPARAVGRSLLGISRTVKDANGQKIGFGDRLDAAIKRLASALDHLDAAVERRVDVERVRSDLSEEYAVMQDDRARLAVELDGILARSQKIEHAAREAGKKLERASSTIRDVLSAHEKPEVI